MIGWSTRSARIVALGAVLLGTVGGSLAPDDVSTAAAPAAVLDPATLTQAPESGDSSSTTAPPAPTTPDEPSTTAAVSTTVAPSTTTATVPDTTETGTVPATTEAPTASTDAPVTSDETVPPSTDAVPSTEVPPTTGEALAPGPDAGAIVATLLAAAPDTYGSSSLDDADVGEADTTFAAGRSFQCGDVVVYFDVLDVSAAAAAGSSTVILVTDFDTSFSDGGTGFIDVAATLAIDDSTYAADGNESLATDVTDNGSGALELTATVGGVDAGERIVVEYRATLGCDPADPPGGALAVTPDSLAVTDAVGATSTGYAGDPVVLDASRVEANTTPDEECPAPGDSTGDSEGPVSTETAGSATIGSAPDDPCAPADCEPYIVGEDGPLVLPEGCEEPGVFRAVAPGQVDNPMLPKQCGTSVTVVIDESASIGNAAGTVRSALTALVNGLNNTGSSMRFIEFSSAASETVSRRQVTTANRSAFDNAITAYSPGGTTNWEAALNLANGDRGALTLVLTDGNPNTYTSVPTNGPTPPDSTSRPLYYGAARADTLKSNGSHMFAIGVGTGIDVANLQVISGNIPYTSALGIGRSDYTATSFSGLEAAIRDLVFDLCSQSLTISKLVGGVPDPGWNFSTTISALTPAGNTFTWTRPAGTTGATASVLGDSNGISAFEWSLTAPGSLSLTVTEASKAGYEFVSARCTVSRSGQADVVQNFTGVPFTITGVTQDAIVKCDANNVHQVAPGTPTVTVATCVNGVVGNHVISIPTTTGITYTWAPQGTAGTSTTYTGTSALNVIVTATAQAGYLITNAPANWTVNPARTSATYTLTAPAVTCRTVTPGTPTATPATCSAGVVTNHVITVPANTADITYSWAPQGTGTPAVNYPGASALDVTVTATLIGVGAAWPTNLAPWTCVNATTATLRLQAAAATCTPVQPGIPTISAGSCVSGAVTNHVISVPANTSSITYSWSPTGSGTPPVNYPGTAALNVTVTATLAATGVAWGVLPTGWTPVAGSNTTATYLLTANPASCTPTSPVAPTVAPAQCVNGATTRHTITPAITTGITYSLNPAGSPAGSYPASPGQTVTVTATLTGAGLAWPTTMPTDWTRQTTTTATYSVVLPTVACTPVQPVFPQVTQATCANGVVTTPTITLPTTPTGVSYVATPPGPYDGTVTTVVTITATLANGFEWGQMPAQWTRDSATSAHATVTLTGASCAVATPATPSFTVAQCVNGATTPHQITVAATDGITYVLSPAGSPPGTYPAGTAQTVVVTATLAGTGVSFPATLPTGWIKVNDTTATFSVAVPSVTCTPVQPVAPSVTQATCANGVVTTPTIVLASTPVGVSYVASPAGPYSGTTTTTVTITATVADGFSWGQLPVEWSSTIPSTATYTVTLAAASCSVVNPVAPTVTPAVCVGGATTTHRITTPTTTGITYTLLPTGSPAGVYPAAPGQSVLVTATLGASGVGWPATLPTGWTKANDTTATFTVDLPGVTCTPLQPAAPTVVQATCANGVVTAPTITLATTPTGVSYVADPAGPYVGATTTTVTITATLADGFSWGQMPAGWTQATTDLVTATFTVTLVAASCTAINPVAPTVTPAQCLAGIETSHTITLATTDGIAYSLAPPGSPAGVYPGTAAQVVTVTATLAATGVGWPVSLPVGWTKVDATTATLTVSLPAVECTPVQPVAPTVTQASCTAGVVTVPTVVLAAGPAGVSYVAAPQPPYDGTVDTTVTITAILANGFEWGQMPADWQQVDLVTATFTVELVGTSCDARSPVAPTVTEARCTGGVVDTHHITTTPTDGITYTLDPPGSPAGTYPPSPAVVVTVTATLAATGVGWPATLPNGWTRTSATTAIFTVPLPAVACTPVIPVAPTVTQASCVNGVVTVPTVVLATEPFGVRYVANPQPPYDGTVTTPVTVTATVFDTFGWAQLPDGWTLVDPATATFAVTLTGTSCAQVTPVAPTVTEAVCADGGVTDHTVVPVLTSGIAYSLAPPGSPVGVYPGTAAQVVTVTATLDPAGVGWPVSLPVGWTKVDATTATLTVSLPAVACTPVVPVAPTVTQASCVNGVVTVPTVVLATTPAGVAYVADPQPPYVGTVTTPVTVTATLADGFEWGQLPADWQQVDLVTATFAVTLTGTSCAQVTPVAPTVTEAVCADGGVTDHTVVPVLTSGIAYSLAPPGSPVGVYPGTAAQVVTVTATLDPAGVGWPVSLPVGWTKVDATTATLTVSLPAVACTPVVPVAPTVTQASCVNGVVTVPTVVLATTPAGVAYVADPQPPYVGTVTTPVTVTATLADGFEWGQLPADWQQVDLVTATFAVTLTGTSCAQVTPVAPTVTEAVCADGGVTDHTVVPVLTSGIAYSLAPPGSPVGVYPGTAAQVVTVTATLDPAGVGWPVSLPVGWTKVDATTATLTVSLPAVACTPVVPVAPTVTQASCVNGVVTVPTVVLATTPAGVAYVADPQPPYVGTVTTPVTVTATLADGFEWGQLPADWQQVDLVTATFAVTLTGTSCAQVTPVAPTVTEAVCADGGVTDHTVVPVLTSGIAYSLAPPGSPVGVYPGTAAQVVTVTATLDPAGVGWPVSLPVGWTKVDATTATLTVSLPAVACTPVVPVAPTVTQASCVNGVVTVPTVVLATTPAGVAYVADPQPPYVGTVTTPVTVTATLADGFEWGQLPADWQQVDLVTATFAVTLTGTSCAQVTPVAPTVTEAVCADGGVTDHTVVPVLTSGIAYSLAPPGSPVGVYPGTAAQVVTVTATLDPAGVGWPVSLPVGWTKVDATTATLTVSLPAVACTPVVPVAPTVTQASCVNGVVTVPTVVLATTPAGVAYVADPQPPYVGTVTTPVTVTATLADGFEWGQLPADWQQVDLVTATFAVTLTGTSCAQVTPVAPTVTEAVCADGGVTDHTVVPVLTSGIAYSLAPPGSPVGVYPGTAAQVVTVTATLDPAGVGWPVSLPVGWTKVDATTATLTVSLPAVACTPVVPVAPTVTQASCVNGVVTVPTVVLATTPAGVAYVADPQPPYVGTVTTPVTVTATLADGFEWGQLPADWQQVDLVTATFAVTLTGTSCAQVTPVAPTVTEAVCRSGLLEDPTLELATTDGITYAAAPAPPYAPGDTVTVTATLDDAGVAWPTALPDGWERTSDTAATTTVTFEDVSCTPVSPVAPIVVAATCVAGDLMPPTVTLAVTPGITYVADPPGPYDPTVESNIVVTATLADGYAWDTGPSPLRRAGVRGAALPQQAIPAGWTIVDPTTATFAITLPPFPPCPTMTPVAPTVTDPQCVDGTLVAPTITLATTEGLSYAASPAGPYVPGDSVTVTATITDAEAGWADPLPDGWALVDPATATFDVTFADGGCTSPTSVVPPPTTTTTTTVPPVPPVTTVPPTLPPTR